ncbi:MAG: hypothetical protein ACE5FG_01210 [Myxococcota bacterium]
MSTWRRRDVLRGAGVALGATLLPLRGAWPAEGFELPETTRKELERSPYVYVSPLHPDGRESRCHGEVWFFVHRGDVVIATGQDRWKARALERGWRRARLWVGDHGRVKKDGERFRKGPSFVAQASRDRDRATFEALMRRFASKYPTEWGKWEPRFRKGYGDGSRVLIRYHPIAL